MRVASSSPASAKLGRLAPHLMRAQYFGQLHADPQHRVQGLQRVLENHRDLGAAHRFELAFPGGQQVAAPPERLAADAVFRRQQFEDEAPVWFPLPESPAEADDCGRRNHEGYAAQSSRSGGRWIERSWTSSTPRRASVYSSSPRVELTRRRISWFCGSGVSRLFGKVYHSTPRGLSCFPGSAESGGHGRGLRHRRPRASTNPTSKPSRSATP